MSNPAQDVSPEDRFVRIARHGAITLITMTQARRRNPLSKGMIAALHDATLEAGADEAVRVVVIAAEGPAYCAGHDLAEITAARTAHDQGRAFFESLMADCAALMLAIRACPKPVIAAVEGIATAAGCQLVATCDLAIAGEAAGFATPGVHIGLFCSTPMVALSRNLAPKHAMEMLLSGDIHDAGMAFRFGLINRVVPIGEALPQALALAGQIAAKPPATLRIGKEAFYHQNEMPIAQAYDYASRVMVDNMLHREAVEGIGAFLGRKKG
ncbi:MAG: enoyl-CoA hydratase [Rhizobiales bacterium]|nr:enoyl-CoA hydratase [Hyphomicrobiales bacterium]